MAVSAHHSIRFAVLEASSYQVGDARLADRYCEFEAGAAQELGWAISDLPIVRSHEVLGNR